jgi:hypothetical protein
MVNVNIVVIYCDTRVIYHSILTFENIGAAVNYCGIFKTFLPGYIEIINSRVI